MNISPMMIKAMFSALGITPEQVMEPIQAAVSDVADAKRLLEENNVMLKALCKKLDISFTPKSFQEILHECVSPSAGNVIEGKYNVREN